MAVCGKRRPRKRHRKGSSGPEVRSSWYIAGTAILLLVILISRVDESADEDGGEFLPRHTATSPSVRKQKQRKHVSFFRSIPRFKVLFFLFDRVYQ